MPSKSEFRHIPQQSRGHRRVDALLCAAATEIGQVGYDASTMSSIAARAGASIGSLYQFFPHKEAIVVALRRRYCDQFAAEWAPLVIAAKRISLKELVNRLVDSMVAFVEVHPAFLALLDAPASTCPGPQAHVRFQRLVAKMLIARKPRMAAAKARRLATMVLQMIKAMNFLCRDLRPRQRRPYVQEFKFLLQCYLQGVVKHPMR